MQEVLQCEGAAFGKLGEVCSGRHIDPFEIVVPDPLISLQMAVVQAADIDVRAVLAMV